MALNSPALGPPGRDVYITADQRRYRVRPGEQECRVDDNANAGEVAQLLRQEQRGRVAHRQVGNFDGDWCGLRRGAR